MIGGLHSGSNQVRVVNYVPILISGNTAIIVPHNNKLAYNTAYYVTIDNGLLTGAIGVDGVRRHHRRPPTGRSPPRRRRRRR